MNNPQLRSFRKQLREIERAVVRHLKDQTPCCGITLAQCHVLMELEEMANPGIAELADRLQLDASTLSRTIDGLVKSGLVSRTENPQNRRSSWVSLTKNGIQTCHQINLVCDEFYSRLFEKIPQSQHASLLKAIGLFSQVFSEFQTETCWKHSLKNLPKKEGACYGKKSQ